MGESQQDYNVSRESAASVLQHAAQSKLILVKDASNEHGWESIIEDPMRRSFSYVLRQNKNKSIPVENLRYWFNKLHPRTYTVQQSSKSAPTANGEIGWTDAQDLGTPLLRKTAWCTLQNGCTCSYEYSDTDQGRATDTRMISVVRDITSFVAQATGLGEDALNCANLNFYPADGGVGFHADDEPLFDGLAQDTAIVSLSLCENDGHDRLGARRFEIRLKRIFLDGAVQGQEPDNERITSVELRHGDIMTMEGLHQLFFLHSVWPGDANIETLQAPSEDSIGHHVKGERINLTWRKIVNHMETCPLSGDGGPRSKRMKFMSAEART